VNTMVPDAVLMDGVRAAPRMTGFPANNGLQWRQREDGHGPQHPQFD
jgi:hypothetical protein